MPAQMAVEISAAREANREKLLAYSWKTRTELVMGGETKVVRIDLVRFDVDGNLQKTTISEEMGEQRDRRGLLGMVQNRREKRQEKSQQEWFDALNDLLEQYSLPTTGKVLDFLDQASIEGGTDPGTARIRGTNVVQPGDELTLIIDADSKQTQQTIIRARLDDDPVIVEIIHDRLASGLDVQARTSITVPATALRMTIENFDYLRQ